MASEYSRAPCQPSLEKGWWRALYCQPGGGVRRAVIFASIVVLVFLLLQASAVS
ncbi:MAG TPA: hypothetical protein VKA01_17830 [Vicinamibacteria bacterium]|nr:hypothetical protein [Vicinamibacteria bacterium]